MMATHIVGPLEVDRLFPTLSPAGCKVLSFLQKGNAYQVLGAWRFRGLRTPVKEGALFSLLKKGLAERVDSGQRPQVKITLAGSAANQQFLRDLDLKARTPPVPVHSKLT